MKNLSLLVSALVLSSKLVAGSPESIQYGHNFLPMDGDKLVLDFIADEEGLYTVVRTQSVLDWSKGLVTSTKTVATGLECTFAANVHCEKNLLYVDGPLVQLDIVFGKESKLDALFGKDLRGSATLTRSTYDWANHGGLITKEEVIGTKLERLVD